MGETMKRIQLTIEDINTTVVPIGFVGENEHTEVVIYWTTLYSDYPSAVATLSVVSPSGDVYPKTVSVSGNAITWEVTAADCAEMGNGQYQLTFTNGTEIIKSYIGRFVVYESIVGSGDPPSPVEDWLTEANAALAALVAWDDVEVSGETPSITGETNKRYICGEVTSISITAPESGMIDVVFVSGSTAATLTTTGVTFPAWFDGTLETNTRYEINVLDGYGVITQWVAT